MPKPVCLLGRIQAGVFGQRNQAGRPQLLRDGGIAYIEAVAAYAEKLPSRATSSINRFVGWLEFDKEGKAPTKKSLPKTGETRLYAFLARLWQEEQFG